MIAREAWLAFVAAKQEEFKIVKVMEAAFERQMAHDGVAHEYTKRFERAHERAEIAFQAWKAIANP